MEQSTDELKTIKVIETPYDLEGREIICYPNLILLAKIKIFRLFMKPRIVYSSITVDLVKGEAARSNKFPEYQELEIDSNALIKPLTTNEDSIKEAKKIILKWGRHKFKTYKVPEIEIIKQEEVYKAFFYTELNNERVLIDSIKGIETN